MIEKLNVAYIQVESDGNAKLELSNKINELVDAVNELQNMQVQVNDHELKIASIYDQLNGFRAAMRENGWNIDWTYPEHIADASKTIEQKDKQ